MPHYEAEKFDSNGFQVVGPFEDGYVLCQILFMNTPERPQEMPQPGPTPFHSIAVYFSHPISIVVSGILAVRRAPRVMSPPRVADLVVG